MVHITNGDSAVGLLRSAGLPGEVFAWNDILHEGPVPADISFNQLRAVRARFIADCGWRSLEDAQREFAERDRALDRALRHDEITLWFEHDLYDQLQLLQLLDWFATCELGATRLTLVCGEEYLGASTPERLAARFPARATVTGEQMELARTAWKAFRAPDPRAIERVLAADTSALRWLAPAFVRHLEQFPSVQNGLSRTGTQLLETLAAGPMTIADAYVASHHEREVAVFLGDTGFELHLAALSATREPLIVTASGGTLSAPAGRGAWREQIRCTAAGAAVLAGEADHVALNGIDRWLGGVQLSGDTAAFRWDVAQRRIRAIL